MIQKTRVRRAPVTGLGKAKRKHIAHVYLGSRWLGKTVIIVPYSEYLDFTRANKKNRTALDKIKGLAS